MNIKTVRDPMFQNMIPFSTRKSYQTFYKIQALLPQLSVFNLKMFPRENGIIATKTEVQLVYLINLEALILLKLVVIYINFIF